MFCRDVSACCSLLHFPLFVLREDKENSGPSPPLQRKPIPPPGSSPAPQRSFEQSSEHCRVRGRRDRELVPVAGYPVERISQYRKLERSFSHGDTTIPLPALMGIPVTSMTSLLREERKRRTGRS